MSGITHKISLLTGYTDKKGVVHTEVEFGKRITVGDLINLDNDPQSQNPTQYADLITRRMIVKFGDLKPPVPLDVLLGLDAVDREDLSQGADEFMRNSRDGALGKWEEDGRVNLLFGFKIGDTVYKKISLGRLLTGRDEVEADKLNLRGVGREAFLIGRSITKLETSSGVQIDGPIELDAFKTLDGEDLNFLRIGATLSKAMFRLQREKIQRERISQGNTDSGNENGMDGSGNTGTTD